MATVSYYTSNTSKPWKAWHDALNEAGMPRTSDTGQYDPNATTSSNTWYEIRTFQGYYIKIMAPWAANWVISVGTGSDGAGNLTGQFMYTNGVLQTGWATSYSYAQLKVIYSENHVTIAVRRGATNSTDKYGFSFGVVDPGTSVETPVLLQFPITYTNSSPFWEGGTTVNTKYLYCVHTTYQHTLSTSPNPSFWWTCDVATQNSPVADQFPLFPLYAWRMDGQAVKIPWMKVVHGNAPLIYEYQTVTVDGDTWQLPLDDVSSTGARINAQASSYDNKKFRLKLVTRIAEA